MNDNIPMQLDKYYTCYTEKRWLCITTTRFCKIGYKPVSVQCLNATQDIAITDDNSGGSGLGM